MISDANIDLFKGLCKNGRGERLQQLGRRLLDVQGQFMAHGSSFSSSYVLTAREVAIETFRERARQVGALLVDVESSDVVAQDVDARVSQLKALLKEQLSEEFATIRDYVAARLAPVTSALKMPLPPFEDDVEEVQVHQALSVALAVGRRVQRLAAAGTNLNFHGSVGAVQTGTGATANVVQNIGSAADREHVLAALAAVTTALQAAASLTEIKRTQSLEVVEVLAAEVKKERPNAISVSGMVEALGFLIQTIPEAEGAWRTVTEWAQKVIG